MTCRNETVFGACLCGVGKLPECHRDGEEGGWWQECNPCLFDK